MTSLGGAHHTLHRTKITHFHESPLPALGIKTKGAHSLIATTTTGPSSTVHQVSLKGNVHFCTEDQATALKAEEPTTFLTKEDPDWSHVLKDGYIGGGFGMTIAGSASTLAKFATVAPTDATGGECTMAGHIRNDAGTLTFATIGSTLNLQATPDARMGAKGSADFAEITTSTVARCRIVATSGFQITSKVTLNSTGELHLYGATIGSEIAVTTGALLVFDEKAEFITEVKAVSGSVDARNFDVFTVTGSGNLHVVYNGSSLSTGAKNFIARVAACQAANTYTGSLIIRQTHSDALYKYDQGLTTPASTART